jgi:hypothetical protein
MTYTGKDIKRMNDTEGCMNHDQFMEYIVDNFTLDGTSQRLISNALFYAESRFEEKADRTICLMDLFGESIGLTQDEMLMFD